MIKQLLVKIRDKLFLNAIKNALFEQNKSYEHFLRDLQEKNKQLQLETVQEFKNEINNLKEANKKIYHKQEEIIDRNNVIQTDLSTKIITKLDSTHNIFEKAALNIMSPTSGALRSIQLKTYDLLKFLKDVCLKNNLTFWIQGGTLLGAKRHQGFIPWDDDIDCGMLREDLDRLREILKDDENYKIIDCYNIVPKDNFACIMPKLVSKKKDYLFIDIFPYDYIQCDNSDMEWKSFMQKKMELTKELCAKNIHNPDCEINDADLLNTFKTIINKYRPQKYNKNEATHIIWGIENLISNFPRIYTIESFFPLNHLLFEDDLYTVPKNYDEYIFRQYGDIWRLPENYRKMEHFEFIINNRNISSINKTEKIIGYTAGAFDLFHIGHLNLLKRAKQNCDYLIVGVTTDELIESSKGKMPFIPLEERIEIIKNCKHVDEVVIQDDLDKVKAWKKYHYNILFSGDDWQGNERWKGYERSLSELGAKVEYFPYTKTISSSLIQEIIKTSIYRGQ